MLNELELSSIRSEIRELLPLVTPAIVPGPQYAFIMSIYASLVKPCAIYSLCWIVKIVGSIRDVSRRVLASISHAANLPVFAAFIT